MRHYYFIWKTISSSHGKWFSSRLGEIPPSSMKWDENFQHERIFPRELVRLTRTNVPHGAFWLAKNAFAPVLPSAMPGKWDEFLPMWNNVGIYLTQVSYPGLAGLALIDKLSQRCRWLLGIPMAIHEENLLRQSTKHSASFLLDPIINFPLTTPVRYFIKIKHTVHSTRLISCQGNVWHLHSLSTDIFFKVK